MTTNQCEPHSSHPNRITSPEGEGSEHRLADENADRTNVTDGNKVTHPLSPPVFFKPEASRSHYTKPRPEFLKIQDGPIGSLSRLPTDTHVEMQ